ncbi:hypothetical protein N0V93_010034 [Gnomoniopsis smithogilvyi]|uniref:Carboxy-cis,cis-muconate cyclase n=1 Tax=Gnomoniopsis smithogilvyi TaxID=1191159 RepID=A0A9W8YIG5_9PEZI|nr:hypothetical protein N0V93_010034 [Gnomoniopsis smithogilvyi]
MHRGLGAATLLGAIGVAHAATHELIVGTFGTPFLYTVEFDDEALTLQQTANTSVPIASSWISLNHDKSTLYGTAYKSNGFLSYSLANGTSLTNTAWVPAGGNCTGSPIFQVADTNPPYAVYGCYNGANSGCGSVMSVDDTGALVETIQNYTNDADSAVHGTAISPGSKFLFSADDAGNQLWAHSIDSTTGEVTFISKMDGPSEGADPRHVAVHPNGTYLYVLLEGSSEVAQYTYDATTGVPTFSNVAFSLLPSASYNTSLYWADEVALSPSGKYLWATNRGRSAGTLGYISVFTLADDGAIAEQKFLLETTNSGGAANAVAPSPFSDRFVALTDSEVGFVEIWELSEDASSAAVVAHLDVIDNTSGKGCCANAVWYS